MKIYVVTSGEYSSYSYGPVFMHEEHAKAYVDSKGSRGGWNNYDYEEEELIEVPVTQRTRWHLRWPSKMPVFESADGHLSTLVRYEEPEPHIYSSVEDDLNELKVSVEWWHEMAFDGRDVLSIQGPSEEAVLKVFSEQRAIYLARKEGIS